MINCNNNYPRKNIDKNDSNYIYFNPDNKKTCNHKPQNTSTPTYYATNSTFGIKSDMKSNALNFQMSKLNRELDEVQTIIQNEKIYNDPDTGKKILNANKDKIWFSDNICLIISTGKIFDSKDKYILQKFIDLFDINASVYLKCEYMVYDYNNDLIKSLEKLNQLDNGNYHVCLFVIVYATDKKILKEAPEPIFSEGGFVEYRIEKKDIFDTLIGFLEKYGFVAENAIDKCSEDKYRTNINGKLKVKDSNLEYEDMMKFEQNIDWNDPTNRKLFSDIDSKAQIDDFATRQRIRNDNRVRTGYSPGHSNRNKIPLSQRIREDSIAFTTIPTNKTSINSRAEDMMQLKVNNKIPEFQLFNQDNTYKDSENIYGVDGFGDRFDIPIANSLNYKKCSRNAKGTMFGSSVCLDDNEMLNLYCNN